VRVDKEFMEAAKAQGLPLFRVQIDWRYVPKDKRTLLTAHEVSGYTSIESAEKLLHFSFSELQQRLQQVEVDNDNPRK